MTEYKLTREGWGRALVELGKENPDVVVLVGDLAASTSVNLFKEAYPDRFIECGIAEQNMATIAAGLSLTGKIPFFATYGAFASCRAADQIRVTICYSNLNVKIGGAHGGISVGPDGATHQALEEIAIMRSLPNMKMIVPADYYETFKATKAAAVISGPVYIRFGREKVPVVTDQNTPFVLGNANILRDGSDVAIIACGVMVYEALVASEELEKSRISVRVINMHTLKPLDEEAIVSAAPIPELVLMYQSPVGMTPSLAFFHRSSFFVFVPELSLRATHCTAGCDASRIFCSAILTVAEPLMFAGSDFGPTITK